MMFFQCASSNIEVRDMADMLLEASAFLYDNLNSSSPKKAFHSHFILQLLHMSHQQYITGALHTVHCIHPPMSNYAGVIGLCGVAVRSTDFHFSCTDRLCLYLARTRTMSGIGWLHHDREASSLQEQQPPGPEDSTQTE